MSPFQFSVCESYKLFSKRTDMTQRIYVNLKKIDVSNIQYFVILNITYYLFVNYSKLDGHVSSAVKDDVILRSTESFLDLVTLFHTQ